MKKFAVTLVDGQRVLIDAVNLHDAVSKARIQYGQLPNDVNAKIAQDIKEAVNTDIDKLSKHLSSLLTASENLDWESVYLHAGHLCDVAKDLSEYVDDARGSLIKV